ncbi:DUF1330 domain-containing protein [bacterium AH-315-N03]|nr:DUF1330 domain-containing protein [bacterium AH-315-N03]
MSALMIARVTIKNPEKFQEYIAKTRELAATFGAKLLHRGKADRALTGESNDHDLTIIVSFPSLEKIDEWYASDAYRPLMALREEGADMQMTSYELMG